MQCYQPCSDDAHIRRFITILRGVVRKCDHLDTISGNTYEILNTINYLV